MTHVPPGQPTPRPPPPLESPPGPLQIELDLPRARRRAARRPLPGRRLPISPEAYSPEAYSREASAPAAESLATPAGGKASTTGGGGRDEATIDRRGLVEAIVALIATVAFGLGWAAWELAAWEAAAWELEWEMGSALDRVAVPASGYAGTLAPAAPRDPTSRLSRVIATTGAGVGSGPRAGVGPRAGAVEEELRWTEAMHDAVRASSTR